MRKDSQELQIYRQLRRRPLLDQIRPHSLASRLFCSLGQLAPFPANCRKTFSRNEDQKWTVTPHIWLFSGPIDETTRHRTSLFSNTLVLPGLNIYEGLRIDDPDKAKWREFVFRARGRDLRGAILDFANLSKVDFTYANLQGATLVQAQLQKASFGGALLQGASLYGGELQGATFAFAHLEGASLFGAQLQGAVLVRLT